MIKVFVVDASPNIRRILTEYLTSDPSIKVVGVAPNISSAHRQIAKLQPDIVTLHEDLHDEALIKALSSPMQTLGSIPLIILGDIDAATQSDLREPLHPRRGRSSHKRKRAIVCKTPQDRRFTEICKRIHQIVEDSDSIRAHDEIIPVPSLRPEIGVVGIAVSTGGPNALLRIVSELSPHLSVPVVITQHMPGDFTPLLVERLRARSNLRVYEAHDRQQLMPGTIYIAPGDRHLTLAADGGAPTIILSDAPKENSCRPSADVMFRSIADVFGEKALCIVLTGMGVDGQKGCRYLKDRGGVVLAQDEGSSTVWGMPKAVITAGLADDVVSLSDIPTILNQRYSKQESSS